MREQLREAAETVAVFIARHAGCNPDALGDQTSTSSSYS